MLDEALGLSLDGTGSVAIVGDFGGTADFDAPFNRFPLNSAGGQDIFLSKYDSAGGFVWAGRAGSPVNDGLDKAAGVAIDSAGNAYVVGMFGNTADFDPGPGAFNLASAGGSDAFAWKIDFCDSSFQAERGYGNLLFPILCTRNSEHLNQDVYDGASLLLLRRPRDRFFLSSAAKSFLPLIVDDVIQVDGVDVGLGPYSPQPGVPPYLFDFPIELNLQPLPAADVTGFLPAGPTSVQVDLLDTDRNIRGHTSIYLVQDCGIWLEGRGPTAIHWLSRDAQGAGSPPEFDVRTGYLSELRADHGFVRAACLGRFHDATATDSRPGPLAGDGYYYLARGLSSCVDQGHGDSTLVPDPRDTLDALPPCP